MTNSFFHFKKSGFSKRQSQKLKDPTKRYGILIDCGLNGDPKMLTLYQYKDFTLLPIYLEVLFNLDGDSETWVVRQDCFTTWVRKTLGVSNSFNLIKRLGLLSDLGLLGFNLVPTALQLTSNLDPIGVNAPNRMPVEQTETQASTEGKIPITNQPSNQEKKTSAKAAEISKKEIDPIWGDGLNLLTAKGNSEQQSRSFLGVAVKRYGKEAVHRAIETAFLEDPAEPKSFIMGCLKNSKALPSPQNTEDADHQAMVTNRRNWFRLPLAVPYERKIEQVVPIIKTSDYAFNPESSPWQIYKKDNLEEVLDFREWSQITPEQADELRQEGYSLDERTN